MSILSEGNRQSDEEEDVPESFFIEAVHRGRRTTTQPQPSLLDRLSGVWAYLVRLAHAIRDDGTSKERAIYEWTNVDNLDVFFSRVGLDWVHIWV
jgi:hypothetical protein